MASFEEMFGVQERTCVHSAMANDFFTQLLLNISNLGPDNNGNTSHLAYDESTYVDYAPLFYDNNESGKSKEKSMNENELLWYESIIPIICLFGFIGNILNMFGLTRRRLLSRMDDLEKTSTYGLIALAFSDMMFCLTVFPHSFIRGHKMVTSVEDAYHLYYKLYGIGLINFFLMASTWLIVYMAINRYIVVAYPFQARWTLGTKRTIFSIVSVYGVSVVFTLPYFLHARIRKCFTTEGLAMYELVNPWSPAVETSILFYMRWLWPVIADFVPLFILALLNIRLINELRKARRQRQKTCRQAGRESSHRVTLTLVVIVMMLLFLVSPAEILRYVNPFENLGKAGHVIMYVTNVLQIVNFAFNFALYCVVSESFRFTVKSIFSCCFKNNEDCFEMQSMLTSVNSTKKKLSDSIQDVKFNSYA